MADFSNRGGSACSDEGERGKRGKRGHDGATGPTGSTGPTGPAGPTGPTSTTNAPRAVLKFSGAAVSTTQEASTTVYLPDVGTIGTAVSDPLKYPAAVDFSLRNFAVSIQPISVPLGGTVTIALLKNDVPVPGFSITFIGPSSGPQGVVAGPVAFLGVPTMDHFDVAVTSSGFDETFFVSATVGIE